MKLISEKTETRITPPHQRELEHLRRVGEEARQTHQGRTVVLHGLHGAGVNALLKEWKRELHQKREHVFDGDCLPGAVAYAPLAEIVTQYVRAVEDLGLMTDELVEIYSKVGRLLGIPRVVPFEVVSDDRMEVGGQILFYENLGRLFTELSTCLSGTVILTNAHLADSATRAAVTYLVQNIVTDPIGTFAPDGVQTAAFQGLFVLSMPTESGMTNSLLRTLGDRDGVSFLNLENATEETVRRFLTSPEVVKRFVDSSGGMADNLEALLETIPEKVEDIFLKRCEHLGKLELRLLGSLAVFGRPVSPDLLLRTLGEEVPSTTLVGLFERRILARRVHGGQLLVDLPTEDNRRLVYDRLKPQLKSEFHGTIASILEERSRFGEAVDPAELAHHFLKSSNREKAKEYAIQAAERLHISFAYEQAHELLVLALPLLDGDSRQAETLDRLVDIQACQNEHRRALGYLHQLEDLLEESERGPVYRRTAEMLFELGDYDEALRHLEKARSLAAITSADGELLEEQIRIDTVAAEVYLYRGQYDRVVALCKSALSKIVDAPSVHAQRQIIRLNNALGKTHLYSGDYVNAIRSFKENVKRAKEYNWPVELVQAQFNIGTIAINQRDYQTAEEIIQEVLSSSYASQSPMIRARCLANLGVVYHKTCQFGRALDAYLNGLATFKKLGNERQFATVSANLGDLYQSLGDGKRARALIEASLEVTRARNIPLIRGISLFVLGGVALNEAKYDEAGVVLNEALETLDELGAVKWVQRVRIRQAEVALAREDWADCEEWLDQVALDGSVVDAETIGAECNLCRARLEIERDNLDNLEDGLSESRKIFQQQGAVDLLWSTDTALAQLYLKLGKTNQAKQALKSASDSIDKVQKEIPEALREAFSNAPQRKRVSELRSELGNRAVVRPRPARRRMRPLTVDGDFLTWRQRYDRIIGEDPKLLQILRMVDKVADANSTVLIQGESGTGKELIAEAIHANSCRHNKPFVKVNCAAFVETLLLSELFGHEKGAFTGALNRKKGRFEMANGGTLFLDEIGDISPNTQVALLRVLQEQIFERVGGCESIDVNVRTIVATNRNLESMVKRNEFRLDLYYRLKGIIMELPPLNERRRDIVRLLEHFVDKCTSDGRKQTFSDEALLYLTSYSWPGNVRELENFTRSITLFVDEPVIDLDHILDFEEFFADGEFSDEIPDDFLDGLKEQTPALLDPPVVSDDVVDTSESSIEPKTSETVVSDTDPKEAMMSWAMEQGLGLPELRKRLETEYIRRALLKTQGNITKAAELLEMKRPRLSQIINSTPALSTLREELTSTRGTK